MNSAKAVCCLLVVGLSQSAPQISQQRVVSQVLEQLQPSIQRLLASSLGGSQVNSFSQQGTTGGLNRYSSGSRGANRYGSVSTSSSSRLNAADVTSSVVTSLQPAIASAVAAALRNSNRPVSNVGSISAEEEERINALQSANAQYSFEYKVGDDDRQTYISQQESRNGDTVEGTYNFVNPAGALVTVNYQAGPMGYTETRDVQEGAVSIDPKNVAQPWTGPLAGVSSSGTAGSQGSSSSSGSSNLSQSELIAQILRAIQPQISSAVQTAVGSRNRGSVSSFNTGAVSNLQTSNSNARRGFNSEANLISSVIGALQPQISGAVQSAIGRTRRPAPVPTRYTPTSSSASSGVSQLFGGSGVRFETPEFRIEY